MSSTRFLPMTREEAGDEPLDVILVTGDAYVDHNTFGVALVGRWLEAHGFSVGVIAQPAWDSPDPYRVLGRPRLFFGVTSGNMDSMVNHYTASRRIRSDDAYSPGGEAGLRPDRACIAYSNRVKQAFPGVPVVLGGIEASLRRFAHYDYWSDKMRRSILLDAKADLLVHGMGELPIVEIARRLAAGETIADCRAVPGVAYAIGKKEAETLAGSGQLDGDSVTELPTFEDCDRDPLQFNKLTVHLYREANPSCARSLVQRTGDRAVWSNPTARALTSAELDRLYELPYQNAAHPCYRQPIPAFESIRGSITVNRGCSGGCSFCALTLHQGKDVVSRSPESITREVVGLTQQRGFNGVISDLGGPTANMFHMRCNDEAANKVCRRVSCLHPVRCKHYGTDHEPYVKLLRTIRTLPGVKRVFVNSGIRYDLAALDSGFVEEIAAHHVSGSLTTAPEHVSRSTLHRMRKPEITHFADFMKRFRAASTLAGKKQFIVPYFQCAHPGTGPAEAIELALYMKEHGLQCRQVQMFMPTPGTLSTAMYVSGFDPHSKDAVPVARGHKERARQRSLMFWWKPEEHPAIREALTAWGRTELIGRGPGALVGPGPARGSWITTRSVAAPAEPVVGAMGMSVERASREELAEEKWESRANEL
ncbi:MAG: YgiQ family radical SAM protein [Myxococcales bacterium]|nr:YgiQ family radical SAM protein [Myxococcales bacterium]